MSNIIQNKRSILKEIDKGILHWHFFSGELSLDDHKEEYDYSTKNRDKWPLLIAATHNQNFYFSPETWSFMIDKNTDFSFVNANELVVEQLHLRIMAKLFASIKKNSMQTQGIRNTRKSNRMVRAM